MNSIVIKICGLTRSEDISVAVSAGANAIGLVFAEQSPRRLEPGQAAVLRKEIPAHVLAVGLFMDQTPAQVEAVLARVPLDLLQFHGNETAEYCASFKKPWIKALAMGGDSAAEDWRERARDFAGARALLLDAHAPGEQGGSGQTFNWQQARPPHPQPLMLAGGLNAGNVAEAIAITQPWAVDVSSGVEIAPGIKDHDQLLHFCTEVRRAQHQS